MRSSGYTTRSMQNILHVKIRDNFFKNFFFLSTIIELNQYITNLLKKGLWHRCFPVNFTKFLRTPFLTEHLRWLLLSSSLNVFILVLTTSSTNSDFNSHNLKGIKFIIRLHFVLSHLPGHEFKHSFQDLWNPVCNSGLDIESTSHYLLYCPMYNVARYTLWSPLRK